MINFRVIRHLWLFLAVAEEKSFGRAAVRLGMSQPPLTQQIQVLEHALGVKLFTRTQRGALLTPAGQAILPAVQKLADQLQRLELAVQEAVSGHRGLLTIGVISSAMRPELSRIIAEFRRRAPDVTLSIVETNSARAVSALASGELDVAFARFEEGVVEPINSVAVLVEQLGVALPRSHHLSKVSAISLKDLCKEDFIVISRRVSPGSYDRFISECRAVGFSPRLLHEVQSLSSQLALVDFGQGIALVPQADASSALHNVVIKPLQQSITIRTVAMGWNAAIESPLVSILHQIVLAYQNHQVAEAH